MIRKFESHTPYIHPSTYIDEPALVSGEVEVSDDVTVRHKALLHACQVGNRVLVGMGSIIMDGVIVEDETIIAAGSLVPPKKMLESGFLWVDSPAKKARPLTDKEKGYLKYSAEHYVRLKVRTENT